MRLYHHPFSSNARRARMTALHLGTSVEMVVVNLAQGEQRKPDFLKMNPNGKVPVLEDDGFYLTESHAIMQYLADKTPGQTIYPTELRARADVNRWLFWCAHHFQPAAGLLNWENNVKQLLNAGPPDEREVKRGEALFLECGRVLDSHLAKREWVLGDKLSLADYALASPFMTIEKAKLPVADLGNIQAWFKRVQALEPWKQTSI